MSWAFGNIEFETYGIYVSRSTGVLNLPKLQFDGVDWPDENGLHYWQSQNKYNDREIILNCFISAKKTLTQTGYEVFLEKIGLFFTALQNEALTTLATPYINVYDCALQNGLSVKRETSYDHDTQIGTFELRLTVRGDTKFLSVPVKDWATYQTKAYLVVNNLVVQRTLQGESYATCSFELNYIPAFHVWDYVMINTNGTLAEPYYFMVEPEVVKLATNKYQISVRLEHGSIILRQIAFLNSSNESDFYFYGNLNDIIDMMTVCTDRFHTGKFQKGSIETTANKLHKFTNENCQDLLKRLAEEYELEYDVRWTASVNYVIDVKKQIAETVSLTLEYGKYNGLYDLSRGAPNRDELVTCLYVFGSNKNLRMDYERGDRLSIAANPLTKNMDKYLRVEKAVTFDEIFPKRVAEVEAYFQVLKADLTDQQKFSWPNGIYRITDTTLNFDIKQNMLGGLTPKVSMLTGDLAGMQFEVKEHDFLHGFIYIQPKEDEAGNLYPNADVQIQQGDEYTLIDLKQDPTYEQTAETELQAAGQAYLDEYSELEYPYKATVYPAFSNAIIGHKFDVGDRLTIVDTDFGLNGLKRISSFTYDVYKQTYVLTLSKNKILSYRDRVKVILKEFDRTQKATNQQDAVTMQNNQETTKELKQRIFDPLDELQDVDKTVRSESIDPRMLSFDAGTVQFSLKNALVETNYLGDINKVKIGDGHLVIHNWPETSLNRFEIAKLKANGGIYDPTRTWVISETVFTLSDQGGYFIYADLDLSIGSTVCVVLIYPEHIEVKENIEQNHVIFKLGYISKTGSPRHAAMLWGNIKTIAEAPFDGRQYVRQNGTWVIISKDKNLFSEINGNSTVSATLSVQGKISATITGESLVIGKLYNPNELKSEINGAATVTGTLTAKLNISSTIGSSSSVTAQIMLKVLANKYWGTDANAVLGFWPLLSAKDWIEYEFYDFTLGTAKSWVLNMKSPVAYTINSLVHETDTGSFTGVAVKIEGVAVTGLSSVTVTSSETETQATANNVVNVGDRVTIEISTGYSGTPKFLRTQLNITRT